MVKFSAALVAALPVVSAWPVVMEMNENLQRRQSGTINCDQQREPAFLSGRPNSGLPASGFNAERQLVDVSEGSGHEYQAPDLSRDKRGQCPGLNAAANHGFLPHNGLVNIEQTITGLAEAYNMAVDLSGFLAVLSVGIVGDYLTNTWSIGGEFPASLPLMGKPTGIMGSHNRYEGDASIVRGDAFLNGGNVGIPDFGRWENLMSLASTDGGMTFDKMARHNDFTTQKSICENPYFFAGPFSALVPPAAHNFVMHFMSNHTEEAPGGVLTPDILETFFAISGTPGNYENRWGQERIPDNWYKRADPLTIPQVNLDTAINNQMYPGILRFGGNTGETNSFAGVDLADATGGVYNSANLLEGNNAICFGLQASQAGQADALTGEGGLVQGALNFLMDELSPFAADLACPQLSDFDFDGFNELPGASKGVN